MATAIKFSTSRAGGLGDQLPAGMIRVYMRDACGDPQFSGENRITHTPKGSSMAIRTGGAFDVKVKVVGVERTRLSSSRCRARMAYIVSNARDVLVTVELG